MIRGTPVRESEHMKYSKGEAKEYAREALRGIWTSLPYHFTADDALDEAAIRRNVETVISDLRVDGHYSDGNVAEFWSMSLAERMRAQETMLEATAGRVPLMAGTHHQSAGEALALTRHAQDIGCDFAILLTPYVAARSDAAVLEFFRYIAERVEIGLVLFNSPGVAHPLSPALAAELARIPNVCAMKQADTNPETTLRLEAAVGDLITISVADETVWLHNMTQLGHRWLLTYTPHLYQRAGYLPVRDYTAFAEAGDIAAAARLSASLTPLRKVNAKWILEPWRLGRMPIAAMKAWMEMIGLDGGPVRPPVVPISGAERAELRADLEQAGLVGRTFAPAAAERRLAGAAS
jgi:4-hydroxy-tetrahydrodipicolinate synthase